MSIKIKRIQSLESGDFNSYNNGRLRAHIEVPASVGMTDLENSQLVFRMNTVVAGNDASAGNLIPSYIAGRQGGDINKPLDIGGAQALIRNARVTSKEYGLMGEIRDANVLNANLDYYTRYSSESGAWMNFDGGSALKQHDPNQMYNARDSMFLDARKPKAVGTANKVDQSVDTEKSQQVSAEVRLPLKCIDRLADGNRQVPNMALGDLTYRIEFEPQPGRAVTALAVDNDVYDCDNRTTTATNSALGNDDNPIHYRPRKGDLASQFGEDNLEFNPFYVGMPVTCTYESNATPQTVTTFIKSLEVIDGTPTDGTQGSIKIVLNDAGASTNGDAITNLKLGMRVAPTTTVDWNIDEIFLELHCLQLSPQQMEAVSGAMESLEIPYTEYRLVKKVLNQTTDYSEMVQTDPGCSGLAVLTPKNNEIVSSIDHARRYRFSIEGKYTTNRDVQIQSLINSDGQALGRQLHNHLLQKFYGNLGKKLLRFDSPGKFYDFSATDAELEDQNHAFYPLVTPIVPNDSIINFQLQADQNMDTKEIFYVSMYPRTLNFKNGRLVM